jgi:hypothetical protein
MIQLTFVELVDRQVGEDMARLTETLRAESDRDQCGFDHEEWDRQAEQADWTLEDTHRAWGVLL